MDDFRGLGLPLGVKPIKVLYKNYKDETAVRTILPLSVYWGSAQWHPQPQWLLRCYDVDKRANRTFALDQCSFIDV